MLRPRTRAALAAARERGLHVIVVTGRMFQAVRRYLTGPEPVVCYQGAVVADPATGEFLRHVPIPLELAREGIDAIQTAGYGLNCYVDDELYVARLTPEAEQYASFQHIELRVVGPLLDWLERPPTKLVVVGDPERLDELGADLRAQFDRRLFIAKSLPFFLELAHPDVSKGSGLQFVADRLGFAPCRHGCVRRRRERPGADRLGGLRRRGRERTSTRQEARQLRVSLRRRRRCRTGD